MRASLILSISLAVGVTGCGFGDDRHHSGDDVVAVCGDGSIDPGEDCDDLDTSDGDGCDSDCLVEAGWSCTGEPSHCTLGGGATCGDGSIDPGEECDDSDTDDGDGCDGNCSVETGWSCTGQPSHCTMGGGVCGDGAISGGEDCDDHDTTSGDGCSSSCGVEAGWECSGSPSVCDLLCGNGHIDAGEECDGGVDCDATCHLIVHVDCTLVPQTGCAGTTPACDLGASDTTACRAVTAMGTSDNHCSSFTACAAGYTCVNEDPVADVCMRFCGLDNQCPGVGSRCVDKLLDQTGTEIPNVTVCSNACDPLAETGCPSGLACMVYNLTGGDVTDCVDVGTRTLAQSCSNLDDCVEGLICVNQTGGGAKCRRMCDVDHDTCPGAQSCTGFTDVTLIGGTEIGACL